MKTARWTIKRIKSDDDLLDTHLDGLYDEFFRQPKRPDVTDILLDTFMHDFNSVGTTMVFRRFPELATAIVPGVWSYVNILTEAFLGLLEPMALKLTQGCRILNDGWVVNLRSTQETPLMVEAFLNMLYYKEC